MSTANATADLRGLGGRALIQPNVPIDVLFTVWTCCCCFFYSDVKRAGNNVLLSPEQGVFGFAAIDLLVGEEDDDIFNP